MVYDSISTFQGLKPGQYSYYAQAAGCADTLAFTIGESTVPELSVSAYEDTKCGEANGTVDLIVQSGNGPFEFGLDSLINATGVFDTLSAGAYLAFVEDIDDCIDTEDLSLAASQDVILMANVTDGTCGNLGSISLAVTGSNGGEEFAGEDGVYSSLTQIGGLESGEYTFYLQDSDNCLDTVKVDVTNYGIPELIIEEVTPALCEEPVGSLIISGAEGKEPLSYSLNGEAYSPQTIYSELGAGIVTFIVTDSTGCTDTYAIEIPSTPAVGFENLIAEQLYCGDFLGDISFAPEGGTGEINYILETTGGQEVDLSLGVPEGQYKLTLRDELGCEAIEYVLIRKEDCTIYFPNIINLNGEDNKFKIGVPDESSFLIESFRIYDRWGNLVYDQENIDPLTFTNWWDGTFNGVLVEQGAYVYTIQFSGESSTLESGTVTVVR